MRIADITGQDTGGQSARLSAAITRFTGHESRSFRSTPDYLSFPVDVPMDQRDERWVADYLATADVIHLHNRWRALNCWPPVNKEAKWLFHQHGRGAQHRNHPQDLTRPALRVVSTLNLLDYVGGDAERWIPAPLDLARFDALADAATADRTADEIIRVAHSPTSRGYKGTDMLIRVIADMKAEGIPIELELIEKTPHDECLRRRARCHITFDQMHLQYGNSGLEGMAFRQPTIVGIGAGDAVRERIRRVVGEEPYIHCLDVRKLPRILRRLVEQPELREEWGERGRRYVEAFHDQEKVAQRVVRLYERLFV